MSKCSLETFPSSSSSLGSKGSENNSGLISGAVVALLVVIVAVTVVVVVSVLVVVKFKRRKGFTVTEEMNDFCKYTCMHARTYGDSMLNLPREAAVQENRGSRNQERERRYYMCIVIWNVKLVYIKKL